MIYFWIAVTVVFVIVEVATTQLVTIWFALGSLAALISVSLNAELYLQIIIFAVVSTIALVLTRRRQKHRKKSYGYRNNQ